MSKKNSFAFIFLLLAYTISAKDKPVSEYLNKHKLPINVNVLSVFAEDCVNCHYGFSSFLKNHTNDLNKKNFVFLFQKSAEGEINNILKYRLELEKNDYTVIVDDAFYNSINKNGVTTLTIIENKQIKEQFTSKNIYQFKSFPTSKTPPTIYSLEEMDTIDLKGRFGTKRLKIDMLNESQAIILNQYSNEICLFNTNKKSSTKKMPITYFTDKYDSILTLLSNDANNLDYNLKNHKTTEFYKTFPLISIRKVSCINNTIYIGLQVSNMVPDHENHITFESKQTLVKLDTNLQIQHIYKLMDSVPNVAGKYISFMDYVFVNSDTVAFSMSSLGHRGKDSICVLYSLKTNNTRILNWSYEPFMPLQGANGYPNYFHFSIFNDNNSIKGFFNRSPYIYNLVTSEKRLLPELGINPTSFDISGKDKFFWISKVFPSNNTKFIIASLKQNEMSILQYDNTLSKLLSKKKIMDGYLDDIFTFGNKIVAFENYSEKGDVATLHVYKLK